MNNTYAQELKSKLERIDQYAVHADGSVGVDTLLHTPITRSIFTFKNTLWVIGIMIIGVSVTAFFTQAILLAVHNGQSIDTTIDATTGVAQDVNPTGPQLYVKADMDHAVFEAQGDATSTPTSADTMHATDLGIPGVSRIGYDERLGEKVLTDNINKYNDNTLVLGGRDGELGGKGKTIGGGDGSADGIVDQYDILPNAYLPVLSSKAYLVADLQTGEIIHEKNSDTVYPLASVSKLMTALVAREKMDMQTIAIVSRDASNAYGAQGELGLGEKIRLRDLQFPLLMESSNDAAEVFADQYGHAKFIEEMNKKAAALEMFDTYYGDPSGLDPTNTSTPKDLLTLARFIYKNDPEIYDITRTKQFSVKGHTWYNKNRLLPLEGFSGGKNGYIDQSRQTTVSLFEIPLAKGGVRTVVIVVLKSDSKDTDVTKLISFVKKSVVFKAE